MNAKNFSLVLSVCAVFLLVQPASSSIVAQWHFNEAPGATIATDNIGGVNGALLGNAQFVSGGISGNAISLSQITGDMVSMGDNFGFTNTDFSIVVWAKVAAGDTTNSYTVISKHLTHHFTGYILGINYNEGGYGENNKAWFYDSNPSYGDEPVSTTTVNDGQWHQIVGVYHKGGHAEIFVDGGGVEDYKDADTIGASDAPLLIGGYKHRDGYLAQKYNGLVDEVQLYNQALTSDEVDYLYHNPAGIIPEPATICLLACGAIGLVCKKGRKS